MYFKKYMKNLKQQALPFKGPGKSLCQGLERLIQNGGTEFYVGIKRTS